MSAGEVAAEEDEVIEHLDRLVRTFGTGATQARDAAARKREREATQRRITEENTAERQRRVAQGVGQLDESVQRPEFWKKADTAQVAQAARVGDYAASNSVPGGDRLHQHIAGGLREHYGIDYAAIIRAHPTNAANRHQLLTDQLDDVMARRREQDVAEDRHDQTRHEGLERDEMDKTREDEHDAAADAAEGNLDAAGADRDRAADDETASVRHGDLADTADRDQTADAAALHRYRAELHSNQRPKLTVDARQSHSNRAGSFPVSPAANLAKGKTGTAKAKVSRGHQPASRQRERTGPTR